MTDPIKRGGVGPVDPSAIEGAAGGAAPRTEGFREALHTEGTTKAPAATEVAGAGELDQLAGELRTGQLSPEQVLDALVERQLNSPAAQMLPPAQRVQLEALLRSRLSEDPTLVALERDLSRGR